LNLDDGFSVVWVKMGALRANPRGRGRLAATGAILALAALAVLVLSGDPASATGQATASGSATVTINHFKFSPTPLRVAKGTTVVFSNASKVKHTATRRGSFDTGKIKPGHSASVRFTAPGTYGYVCKIHPEMHGKIIVG
jgi:plastocyanin